MKIDLNINCDFVDAVVLVALKDHLKVMRESLRHARMKEDREYDRKVIAALRVVIKHYGG